MSTFHSICVNDAGSIAHANNNQYGTAIRDAGWCNYPKNSLAYCIWDGNGDFDLRKIVDTAEGTSVESLTEPQREAIEHHYLTLKAVMSGSVDELFSGGVLHGINYWDVYDEAARSGNTSEEDRVKIVEELLTVTAEHGQCARAYIRGRAIAAGSGVAKAGGLGKAVAGDYGIATAYKRGSSEAGDHGTAIASFFGIAVAGSGGLARVATYGHAEAGNYGYAIADSDAAAKAGECGLAVAGESGKAAAGLGGALVISMETAPGEGPSPRRFTLVDGENIKADIFYRLDGDGNFVEA